ncbi:phospholipid/cholesterol/gamma-HCH transport system substrate-binding protein [Aeromicrobium panaciterrae]|uniref:Phospholipid/cholesterol/gamma-HCH transport system substrate-binding protein n=1 Tax=Aeromicrobium panaciterrae TaxID=363861 RepID=A0ABU1URK8_9ACTN|nr:MCE family protein [Aeromicrobium panaciterrae]MDR7087811.1 phospholipid/cholesterol/gamma-HCH transport system substrate-binding protein [Aeromicrobium panaciterrae]
MKLLRVSALTAVAAMALSGCGFSPYKLPLPGGADLGDKPYTVKVEFRDVLDLVPQSAVRVNDIAVGKVTDIKLNGWTALVTVKVNKDTKLPDNAEATIRQTSLLGEKFVSLAAPKTGASGTLSDGDVIPLDRAGRNPEIEEVLGAASLLFNGGGIEKTNTIVKELNLALGGNEPEVKELIDSTSQFLTQLDNNKAALLTSLEKVNNLAVETNKQKAAITGALDDLPEALTVINGQRDDLVKLLESLHRLGDVATDVIRRSKDDAVADFKALVPTLTNLAKAGDDLAYATKALLSFPFSDGFVGNTYAVASGKCIDGGVKEGACFGDFANLSLGLDISAEQLTNILNGYAPEAPTPSPTQPLQDLVNLVTGLVPGGVDIPTIPGLPQATPTAGSSSGSDTTSGGLGLPSFCSLLGQCRAPVASADDAKLAQLLIGSVVTS